MNTSACIAHAIHQDMDIVDAMPSVMDLPMEQLEHAVHRFVCEIQETLEKTLAEELDALDRRETRRIVERIEQRTHLPMKMIQRMMDRIVSLRSIDARFIGDLPGGSALYEVRMRVSLGS